MHLFENLFLAQHGTTLKYKFNKGIYEPILDEYEYSNEEKKIFENIQSGALKFIEDINNSYLKRYLNINYKIASLNVLRLGLKPNNIDIEVFGKTPYMETIKMPLIDAKNIIYYIFHVNKLKIDFLNSGWKIGFLKKVFILNFDYFKLYKILLKYII